MQSKFNNWKINLINLNHKSIIKLIKLLNFKSFISSQLIFWIYKNNINDFNDMKNISFKFLVILSKICKIKINDIKKEIISKDNTIKWLMLVDDYNSVEVVAIPNKKENYTLCMSSQVGCAMNCSFCYTGNQGFLKNMRLEEILSQLLQAKKRLKNIFKDKKITNIVFMGMGEPLLNINNVLFSIDIINNKFAFNIHKNKITVSTSGILHNLKYLYLNKIPLALSLHSAIDNERSSLMPINKKYSIKDILSVCKNFEKFTVEYIMIKGVNDSVDHAFKLVNLLNDFNCKICLIPFNSYPGSIYDQSDIKSIISFKQIMIQNGKVVTIRKRFGYDIYAACGQLKGFINSDV